MNKITETTLQSFAEGHDALQQEQARLQQLLNSLHSQIQRRQRKIAEATRRLAEVNGALVGSKIGPRSNRSEWEGMGRTAYIDYLLSENGPMTLAEIRAAIPENFKYQGKKGCPVVKSVIMMQRRKNRPVICHPGKVKKLDRFEILNP